LEVRFKAHYLAFFTHIREITIESFDLLTFCHAELLFGRRHISGLGARKAIGAVLGDLGRSDGVSEGQEVLGVPDHFLCSKVCFKL
jgi:hypothetical protein